MPTVHIRPARADDAETILGFIKQLADYEKLRHEVVATPEDLRRTLFGDRPFAEVLLLEEDSFPQGFALFFHSYSTFLGRPGIYLEDLFVNPTTRGRGYGKKLLAHLAGLALDRGCGRLDWAVLDWNKPAIDFYLSIGAQPLEEWTTFRMTEKAMRDFARK